MKGWKKSTMFLPALVISLSLSACGMGSSEDESKNYYTPGAIDDTDYTFTDGNPAEHFRHLRAAHVLPEIRAGRL